MVHLIPILALLFGARQVGQPCDTSCQAVVRATIQWVAESRRFATSDMVLQLPTHRNTPDEAAYAGVLARIAGPLGIRPVRGSPVTCQSPEGLDVSKLPPEWWANRCRMPQGRLLVRILNPPTVAADSATVYVSSGLYNPMGDGYGYSLTLRRTPDGWRVTKSVLRATGSPAGIKR
jgi:hypothetical protein